MNKFLFLVLVVAGLSSSPSQAQSVPLPKVTTLAQFCYQSNAYAPADRAAIKKLFSETVTPVLARMKEISYLNSMDSSIVSLGLMTHRMAFEQEFHYELEYVLQLGISPGIPLQPLSRRYVAQTLSAANLGFTGLTLAGATQAEAEQNSLQANTAVTTALTKIWSSF
jgi:hypothetical protein